MKTIASAIIAIATVAGAAYADTSDNAIDPHRDYHSYANIDQVRMTELYFYFNVNFETSQLEGFVELTLDHLEPEVRVVVLDSKALEIDKAEMLKDGAYVETT